MNKRDVVDKKNFCKTIKPLLSDKIKSSEKIYLIEGERVVTNNKENADILNKSFSNAVKNLRIPDFSDTEPLPVNISLPTLTVIMKYRNHPSVAAIKKKVNGKTFKFFRVSEKDIVKGI